jgi:hypothetical protein
LVFAAVWLFCLNEIFVTSFCEMLRDDIRRIDDFDDLHAKCWRRCVKRYYWRRRSACRQRRRLGDLDDGASRGVGDGGTETRRTVASGGVFVVDSGGAVLNETVQTPSAGLARLAARIEAQLSHRFDDTPPGGVNRPSMRVAAAEAASSPRR